MMTRFFAGAVATAVFLGVCPYVHGQSTETAFHNDVPMQFEANAGQTDASVKFLARGANSSVFMTAEGAVLSLSVHAGGLRMSLAGSNTRTALTGVDPLPGKVNYLNGRDPARWRTGIPSFGGVKYSGVYPGIDLVYYGKRGRLEYDFAVAPGADPRRIVGPTSVTVSNTAGTSAAYPITLNSVQPGLLAPPALQTGGKQYVAALFPDGQTFALPAGAISGVLSRPAKPGETLVFYGVGFGPVTPTINAGTVVSQQNSLAMPLQISFGSVPATVTYQGLAPNFTGLYQFNVVVPQVPDDPAMALTFTLAGQPGSQTLAIAVHQ